MIVSVEFNWANYVGFLQLNYFSTVSPVTEGYFHQPRTRGLFGLPLFFKIALASAGIMTPTILGCRLELVYVIYKKVLQSNEIMLDISKKHIQQIIHTCGN